MSKSFRVVHTSKVYDQLIQICDYIRADSAHGAIAVLDELDHAIQGLRDGTVRHTCVGKSRSTGFSIHRMIVGSYLVYYRVNERARQIDVFEVRHGARRQPRRFS